MSEIDDHQIDELIILSLSNKYLKTARVIYEIGEKFNRSDNIFYNRIEIRLSRLLADGKISVRGDLSNWRWSEIALKNH